MNLSLSSIAPFSVRSINLGTSTPPIQPSINLSQCIALTSFNGGTNSLSSISGFSSLASLRELTLGTVLSTVNFEYKTLPANLKAFSVTTAPGHPQCQIRGDFKDWPRTLEYFNGATTQNRLLSGDIADLPRTLIEVNNVRFGTVWGHLSSLPPNIRRFVLSTNQLTNALRGRFSNLPPSLTAISFFETSTLGCEWVWSELPPTLSGIYFTTNTTISGNIADAPHLRSLQFGSNVLFAPNPSINIADLPRGLTFLNNSSFINGDLINLPTQLAGGLTINSPVSGTLTGIPSGVTTLTLAGATFNGTTQWGGNTVSGNINLLNTPNLVTLALVGANTITGDLSGIPRSVTSYSHTNTQNTVTGNVSSLPPGLITYDKRGNAVITGNVADIPRSVTSFNQTSTNSTLAGNIGQLPPSITTFIATANTNSFSGNLSSLPATLNTFSVGGNTSTITGNITSLPPNLNTYLVQSPNNFCPIIIDVSTIPSSITSFTQQGTAYTMFGNLTALPNSITAFTVTGTSGSSRRANLQYYNGFTEGFGKKIWSNALNTLNLAVSTGTFSASHLATLVVDLTSSSWTNGGTITLNDSSMPSISMSTYPQAKLAIEFLRLSKALGGRGVTVNVLTAV